MRTSALASIIVLGLAGLALAQDPPAPDAPAPTPAPAPPAPDGPPTPAPETPVVKPAESLPPTPGRDVLHLSTGERLEGQFVQLDAGTYHFKSDALDAMKVPSAKVTEFDAGRTVTVVTSDGRTLEGPARLDASGLTVWTADGPQRVSMADVVVINPKAPPTELEKWHAKLTLGATSTQGNTHNKTLFAIAGVNREDDWTRLTLGYQTAYGTVSGDESTKSHRGDGQFDIKVTERLFLTPVVANAYYDKFQNISYRYRIGSGAGYFILKEADFASWSVECGGAYGVTRFRRIQPGEARHRYETSIRAASRLEIQITENIAFKGFYESYIGAKNVKDTVHHAEAQISFKYGVWSFDAGVIYDRIENPQRRADGTDPRRDDSKFFVGLGIAI